MTSQWHINRKAGERMKSEGMFEPQERSRWAIVYDEKLVASGNQPLYDTQKAAEEDARRNGWLHDAYIMQI